MSLKILLSTTPNAIEKFSQPLRNAMAKRGLDVQLEPDFPPDAVDYIIFGPNPKLTDFSPFVNARAVLSLWAGVETIANNPTLTQPLARMVDPGLREGMVEWVTGHVLRYHLGMDAHIVNPNHKWSSTIPPFARHRHVGILGLGELGSACAAALAGLNFNVTGWSRRLKIIDGFRCLSGEDGLQQILKSSEILVLLLPLTPQTENLLGAQNIALMPAGARIVNPGRGALIDDDALLGALDIGQIGHATLDVFRQEPLPKHHAYWKHANVTVTPHIASETRADTASAAIANNIHRAEAGEGLLNLVDRQHGY